MIKAVLFDYGGVLSPSGGKDDVPKALAHIYGIEQDEVKVKDLHEKLLLGDITDETFVDELNRRHTSGTRLIKALFFEKVDMLKRNEEIYKLAVTLRANGIRTGILSNAYAMTAELLQDNGLYEGFDPVVLSCQEHLKKPSTEFYQIAIQKLGIAPTEIIFVDDQEKCLPPAEKLGMHVVQALSPEQAIADTLAIIERENSKIKVPALK